MVETDGTRGKSTESSANEHPTDLFSDQRRRYREAAEPLAVAVGQVSLPEDRETSDEVTSEPERRPQGVRVVLAPLRFDKPQSEAVIGQLSLTVGAQPVAIRQGEIQLVESVVRQVRKDAGR